MLLFGEKWILRWGVAVAAKMAIMAQNGPKMEIVIFGLAYV